MEEFPECRERLNKLIYDTVFVQGVNSDIQIIMLGKEWSLHTSVLNKHEFFRKFLDARISGFDLKHPITINFHDPRLTVNGLHKVLGFIYTNIINFTLDDVTEVLRAAFTLEERAVIKKCIGFMCGNTNATNVCLYYEIGDEYEIPDLINFIKEWLRWSFAKALATEPFYLRQVRSSMMKMILSDPALFTTTEIELYIILRKWLFLQLTTWEGNAETCDDACSEFLENQKQATKDKHPTYFLETEEGQSFIEVFRKLRLQYCNIKFRNVELIEKDKIIPKYWLIPIDFIQHATLLNIEDVQQNIGATSKLVSNDNFNVLCRRVGHIVQETIEQTWSWNVVDQGIHLIVEFQPIERIISLKRKIKKVGLVNSIQNWSVMYSMHVAYIDDKGLPVLLMNTPIKEITMQKNFIKARKKLPSSMKFPLVISLSILTVVPIDTKFFLDEYYRQELEDSLRNSRLMAY